MKHLKQSLAKWLVVSMLFLLIGFSFGKFKLSILEGTIETLKVNMQSITADKIALTKRMAAKEAIEITDKQTIKRLEEENKNINEQLNILTNKLYFYERVVAPELQSPGAQVYSFSVNKGNEADLWTYELVLMQAEKGRRLLKGKFTLHFSFMENEQLQTASMSDFCENITPTFNFKYFQRINGDCRLPADIAIEEVILKINVPKDRWHKAQQLEQHYNWQSLVVKERDDLSEPSEQLPDLETDLTSSIKVSK